MSGKGSSAHEHVVMGQGESHQYTLGASEARYMIHVGLLRQHGAAAAAGGWAPGTAADLPASQLQ
jgi:hypothetical protein